MRVNGAMDYVRLTLWAGLYMYYLLVVCMSVLSLYHVYTLSSELYVIVNKFYGLAH